MSLFYKIILFCSLFLLDQTSFSSVHPAPRRSQVQKTSLTKKTNSVRTRIQAQKSKIKSRSGPSALSTAKYTEIEISLMKYPHSAKHILDAQKNGHPTVLTIDRSGARANRILSLKGIKTAVGLDRDEYPPAMFAEGGRGASVRLINSSDNRGAGASIGGQCRNLPNGTKVILKVVP